MCIYLYNALSLSLLILRPLLSILDNGLPSALDCSNRLWVFAFTLNAKQYMDSYKQQSTADHIHIKSNLFLFVDANNHMHSYISILFNCLVTKGVYQDACNFDFPRLVSEISVFCSVIVIN